MIFLEIKMKFFQEFKKQNKKSKFIYKNILYMNYDY